MFSEVTLILSSYHQNFRLQQALRSRSNSRSLNHLKDRLNIPQSAIETTTMQRPLSFKSVQSSESQDVHTILHYLKHPGPGGLPIIDSGVPKAERRMAQRQDIREAREVSTKDIRGGEDDFKRDAKFSYSPPVQGFQYLPST
jgi:hypothetical protein